MPAEFLSSCVLEKQFYSTFFRLAALFVREMHCGSNTGKPEAGFNLNCLKNSCHGFETVKAGFYLA